MLAQFTSLGAWDWFIIGGLLFVLEVLAPGVFLAWLGLAALAVGCLSFYVNWTWQAQFIAFAVFSVVLVPLWQRLAMRIDRATDQPFLNRRAESFIGRTFTLQKPIVNGSGSIGVDDTVWRITGADLPAGSRVKITRIDGTALHVELVGEPRPPSIPHS